MTCKFFFSFLKKLNLYLPFKYCSFFENIYVRKFKIASYALRNLSRFD